MPNFRGERRSTSTPAWAEMSRAGMPAAMPRMVAAASQSVRSPISQTKTNRLEPFTRAVSTFAIQKRANPGEANTSAIADLPGRSISIVGGLAVTWYSSCSRHAPYARHGHTSNRPPAANRCPWNSLRLLERDQFGREARDPFGGKGLWGVDVAGAGEVAVDIADQIRTLGPVA